MSGEITVRWGDGGFGFIADDRLYLQRCGQCQRENYGPNVATGQCTWCGDEPDPTTMEQS